MVQFKGWQRWQGGCLALGLSLVLGWGSPAQAAEGKCYKRNYTFNFLAENDLWGSGSDKHFTHGTRISFVESREEIKDAPSCTPEQRENESGGLDFIRNIADPLLGEKSSIKTNQVSFILGQNIFTPEDISNPNLILNDRPYAGWLYFGVGLMRSQIKKEGFAIFDTLELDLGIVGPEAYAQDVQIWWHKNISDSPRPAGWDNQLKNEPGILLNLERKWRMELTPHNYEGLQVDFLPSVGAALGNVYTYASVGTMFRLGVNLPVDYGPPRIRPGAQGSDFFQYDKKKPVSWYAYAGVEGRALAVNIFLDGNTFADSHSVDKKYFVGDFHTGFVLVIYHVRLAFSQVFRSSEFNGQQELSEFGSINLSVAW
ncbi:MAG: lipid A deacylase LpxR family protein [Nitrospinaceae bacterium]